jgi:hypothetical protein
MSTDPRFAGDEPPGDPFLYSVIDQLVASFGAPELAPELARAREDYETRRGKVRQEEELWEVWSQIFLEWFALEWPGELTAPPAARALSRETDERTRTALEAWLRSQRALIEVIALRPGIVRVRDLLRGGLFEVAEQRSLHGVGAGDIAEVRLVGFDGRVRFGRTFLFHPSGTRAVLAEQVEQRLAQGATPEGILDQVAALRLRTDRYRHVDPIRLYRAATEELGEA